MKKELLQFLITLDHPADINFPGKASERKTMVGRKEQ